MSKVGHILTEKRWERGQYVNTQHVIIGEYSVAGRKYYYIPAWNTWQATFCVISADSSFLVGISENAYPMSETHKTMARALEYKRLAGYCETIRKYYAVPHMVARQAVVSAPTASYQTRMELGTEYESVWEDAYAGMAKRAAARRDKYAAMYLQELQSVGLGA